jgi:hypothetical protein
MQQQAASTRSKLPRGRFITQHLIAYLNDVIDDPLFDAAKKKGKSKDEVTKLRMRAQRVHFLVRRLFDLAMEGDMQAIKYVIDRIEGTAIQTVQFTPEKSDEEIAAENARLAAKRDEMGRMTQDQKNALYARTLQAMKHGPGGEVLN